MLRGFAGFVAGGVVGVLCLSILLGVVNRDWLCYHDIYEWRWSVPVVSGCVGAWLAIRSPVHCRMLACLSFAATPVVCFGVLAYVMFEGYPVPRTTPWIWCAPVAVFASGLAGIVGARRTSRRSPTQPLSLPPS